MYRSSFFLSLILGCCLVMSCDDNIDIEGEYNIFNNKLLGAHRGCFGYPENTFLRVKKAIELGYDIVEFDVAKTKDSVFVVHHDNYIFRTSNGGWRKISENTYNELLLYDFGKGEKLPKLYDMLIMCKEFDIAVELDVSNNSMIDIADMKPIYDVVNMAGMIPNVLFCSTIDRLMSLSEIDNSVNMSLVPQIGINMVDYNSIKYLKDNSKIMFIDYDYKEIDRSNIGFCHSLGIKVNAYVCNNIDSVIFLFNEGVDYILTENVTPSQLRSVINE